jgi:riboflavin kinase/FMN adenylyltransferase
MEIIRELTEIPNLSIALGLFDGVHIGHRAVIECAVEAAQNFNCKSAVITFKEQPLCYLKNIAPKYILSLEDKYKAIEKLGVDYVIELDFPSICKLTPEQYLNDIIVKYFSPKAISTGFNHYFGVDRSGNVHFLSDFQDKYDYIYFATPPQSIFGDIISSTAIREFIKEGVMDMAASMLGNKFYISGTVVKGKNIGTSIGFPTANVIYPPEIIEPPYGVYDTEVELEDGRKFRAVVNFGTAPTISNEGVARIEAHLLDFNENIYGQTIKINFGRLIRPEMKFDSLDELKTQIEFDIQSLY